MSNNIIDIIESAVSRLRTNFVISSIVDNTDDTYTITVVEKYNTVYFAQLQDFEVVNIENTVGFNGEYKITNLDTENKTFIINFNKGVAIPVELGNIQKKAPYFYPENIQGLNEYLTGLNESYPEQLEKFPLFYLFSENDVKEYPQSKVIENLTIYIINTSESKRDVLWRNENTMPFLRQLQIDFMKSLNKECSKIGNPYDSKEIFYGKPDENINNSITDAIKLTLEIEY